MAISENTWDNEGTTKNGPDVIDAETSQSRPNPYEGGAGMKYIRSAHLPPNGGAA